MRIENGMGQEGRSTAQCGGNMLQQFTLINIKGHGVLIIFKTIDQVIEICHIGGFINGNTDQVISDITQIDLLAFGLAADRGLVFYFDNNRIKEMIRQEGESSFQNSCCYGLCVERNSFRNIFQSIRSMINRIHRSHIGQ